MTIDPVPRFRLANRDDVPTVAALLADDVLGRQREVADTSVYVAAFDAMQAESDNQLVVGEMEGQVMCCYQLTFVSGLSLAGARRAQLEGVRVAAAHRGSGIGEAMMADAAARARAAGCRLLQLTTNRDRPDAHRFYERVGFTPSHVGYKMLLEPDVRC